jgi:uncharacterized membrane protein
MADKNDIIKKLNELLKKSEDLQKDLRQLNEVILYSDILEPKKQEEIKPVPEEKKDLVKDILNQEPVINIVPPEKKEEEFLKINLPKENPVVNPGLKKPVQQPVLQKQPVMPPKVVMRKPPRPSFFERNPDLEKWIGERLISLIGIAVLVIGIAYFVKFAIDKNWINEIGRTFIGILSGGLLIGIGHRLRKSFVTFSSVLIGGGIAVEYFSVSYAYHVYHMFPMPVAFALLVAITLFTVTLAVAYDRKELAVIAIVGGFTSPLMVASNEGHFSSLCSYMLILDIGMLVLAYYKKWNIVNVVSYAFTVLLFGGALVNEVLNKPEPAYVPALVFGTAFYLTFFLMNVINNLKHRVKFQAWEIIALLSNTCLYYAAGYFILQAIDAQVYQGLFTLVVAIFNCVFAYLLFRRQEVDRTLVYFLIGIVLTFVSLAGPVQLEGNNITLFWSAEMVMLYWLYLRSEIKLIRLASVILNALMLVSLLLSWMRLYFDKPYGVDPVHMPLFINRAFLTGLFSFASLLTLSLLYRKEKDNVVLNGMETKFYARVQGVLALAVLYLTFFLEFWYQLGFSGLPHAAQVTLLCYYNTLFMLGFLLVVRFMRLDHLKVLSMITAFIVPLLYFLAPHFTEIEVRNDYLGGNDALGTIFNLHYLNTAMVAAIITLLFVELRNLKIRDTTLLNGYLWFLCITGVFMVSAELDHIQMVVRYSPLTENRELIMEQSHNVTWIVAWCICSFIMIAIGMRKSIRQLRIFSLSLFFISVLKLIILGMTGESEAGKIIAYISAGILLLVVGFMYQRVKKLLTEEDKIGKETVTVNTQNTANG